MSDKPPSLPEPPKIVGTNQTLPSIENNTTPQTTVPESNGSLPKPQQTKANNLGENIYENEDEIFNKLDIMLDDSLKALDLSFQQCLEFADFLIDNNSAPTKMVPETEIETTMKNNDGDIDIKEVTNIDQSTNGNDSKPPLEYQGILSEDFVEKLLNDDEFKHKLFDYHRRITLSQHKALSALISKDSNKSIFANVFKLEAKEIPDIEKKFQKLLNGQYFLKSYENDLIYRSKISFLIQENKFPQTNKSSDLVDYTKFEVSNEQIIQGLKDKLEDEDDEKIDLEDTDDPQANKETSLVNEILKRDDIQFLDLKAVKSDLYLNYLDDVFKQKLKYKLLNESLIESKSKFLSESSLWSKRKEKLDNFFNVEISNIGRVIDEINKDN